MARRAFRPKWARRGTWEGDVKDVIALLEKRAFVNVLPSKWWTLCL
jgi:hypothetical protein